MATTLIKHVFGNAMRIAIPLSVRVRTMSEGKKTEVEQDFFPNTELPIEVKLMREGGTTKEYEPTVSDNIVIIEDDGTLPVGTYQLTVTCFDDNEQPYRYMVRNAIQIVAATADADLRPSIEFDSQDYVLDGAVFFYAKGDKGDQGVGIEKVEQIETSTESGGVNIVRITLTDGNYTDIEIRNGN